MERCKHGLAVGTCAQCGAPRRVDSGRAARSQAVAEGRSGRHARSRRSQPAAGDSAVYGAPWSDDELRAAVDAYQRMLTAEQTGTAISKRDAINLLVQATGRTPRALQARMMNISAILDEKGAAWIGGFKPLSHVTNRLREIIDEEYPSLGGSL